MAAFEKKRHTFVQGVDDEVDGGSDEEEPKPKPKTGGMFVVGVGIVVDETAILLHPPLPLVGVSIVMERERQQNDSLVNG